MESNTSPMAKPNQSTQIIYPSLDKNHFLETKKQRRKIKRGRKMSASGKWRKSYQYRKSCNININKVNATITNHGSITNVSSIPLTRSHQYSIKYQCIK